MKFTGNDKGVRAALVVLLVLFAIGAGWCSTSRAEDALSVGFGSAYAGAEGCFDSLLIAQELNERRWLTYLFTHGDSPRCRDDEPIPANIMVGLVRTTHLGKWTIGFGAGVLEHGDVIVGPESILSDYSPPRVSEGIQLCANIVVRRLILRGRAAVDLVHCSTGNATYFNRGLNGITLSARIGR